MEYPLCGVYAFKPNLSMAPAMRAGFPVIVHSLYDSYDIPLSHTAHSIITFRETI